MKKIYLFFMFLLCCGVTYAQTTITGTVTDNNNMPLPGANVRVVGESAGTVTDASGNFSLTTTLKPPFSVEVSNVAFGTKITEILTDGQKINVVLAEQENKLDEIVVSASRTPERVIESPVTIERMNLQQIKSTTAATYYDGLENLKEVHFNTSSLSFKSINTRGFATVANTRFMQLVDGMDNSSPALNFVLGNLIGVSELDVANVELLPGASSALYGANAFNGILFMNSRSPFTHQGISVYGKYGKTSQKTAGENDYWDFGIRAAKAFSDKFAAKANFTVLRATEWIASDERNVTGSSILNDPYSIGHAANPNYDGLNSYGDEVSTNIKDVGQKLADLGIIPDPGLVNLLPDTKISRTGYREQDLSDNKIESVKADFSLHFKPWANDFEIILQSKIGTGNTVYQGANRYALKNFYLNQNKLEVKGRNFFVRGYMTDESAGDSYDTRFAAWNINRAWKDDSTWFGTYAGAFIQSTLAGQGAAASHAVARAAADAGRFEPGSQAFKNALATVITDSDLTKGAKFVDHSRLYHSDVNYNFRDVIKFAEIQVGGSFRQYEMNSEGSIFTDYDGPIRYDEYGAYTQVTKKFLAEERLKFTGSIRYDKSQNFDGFVSPRIAIVYSAGANKRHNFRVSYQTGFRNPTTQDQYIGLDLGPFALIGSAPDNLTRFSEVRQDGVNGVSISPEGQAILGTDQVTMNGLNAYNNSYTEPSVDRFKESGNAADLEIADVTIVKPERVQAFELGYRSVINNDLSVDINGYYNIYNDFLNQSRVYSPYYGTVGSQDAIDAIDRDDSRRYQVYSNSKAEVTSIGFGVGISKKVYKDFELGANYNFAEFEFDQQEDPAFIPGFNTPKHRIKGSFGNERLFPNFGFNINVRWSTEYLWQSSFADGTVPENTVLDAQINYAIPKIKSLIKVGATNLFGEDYIQVIGAGAVGQQWFVSWTINP